MHSIGGFDVEQTDLTLRGNQVYTNLFPKGKGKEYVCFRNPHTSPSNVLVVENIHNDKIEKYFNLSKNIVCINNVKTTILETLNGADMDSDTMAIFDSEILLKAVKDNVEGKYRVCLNEIESEKVSYAPTMYNMAKIDNVLANSQRNIGKITNIGQQAMSKYWDGLKNGVDSEDLSKLLKNIDVMAVLSGVAIDMSKKLYKIDLKKEIKNIDNKNIYKEKKVEQSGKVVKINPLFFQYVKASKTIKNRVGKYETPMDYLYIAMRQYYAKYRKSINFNDLLIDCGDLKQLDKSDIDYAQHKKIMDYISMMNDRVNKVYLHKSASEDQQKEELNKIDDIYRYCAHYLSRLTIKPATMHHILSNKENYKNISEIRLMMMLHKTQTETFLNTFKTS